METIESRILQYLDRLQDIDYLAAIVNSVSLAELNNIIDELLRSENDEIVSLTCLFIRDLVLLGSRHSDCDRFVQSYSKSSIVKTLEQLIFSNNYFIRIQAVYTLGKTNTYSSVSVLNQAFNELRDSNPILLPRLMGEMGWLGTENFWELLDSMINSNFYMTRWAVIDALSEFIGDDARAQDELFQDKFRCIDRLRRDSNMLVQIEAEYEYQLLKFRREADNLTKAERRKKRKEIERKYKPALCFSQVSIAFRNHLYNNGLKQYSVDELEAFAAKMAQLC
ncbi:MAG: hypothetical protein KME17_26185 [Cyanosarcina radialis HA8281-LM2]|jgi:hypothetical protein|nr:hypothetical protein [Cyanosarcina radialis HA8281-LM2]